MDKDNLKAFLRKLHPNAGIVDNGDWLNTSCPLSPWTHERGTDCNPSFGVHVNSDGASMFNCLACHHKGPLSRLLILLERYSGISYETLRAEIESDGILAPLIRDIWKGDRDGPLPDSLGEPVDEEWLHLYESAIGHPYLEYRGVLDETARDLGLCLDPDNRGVERILFPVYSHEGLLYGFSGRATNNKSRPKVRDYFGLDKRLLLLGSHLVRAERGAVLVLVEGLFDYAIISQLGYPVVASMQSRITEAQAVVIRNFGIPVIVFYDNDKAGRDGVRIVYEKLYGYVPVLGVSYPKGQKATDPGSLPDAVIDSMISDAYLL